MVSLTFYLTGFRLGMLPLNRQHLMTVSRNEHSRYRVHKFNVKFVQSTPTASAGRYKVTSKEPQRLGMMKQCNL